MASIVSVPIPIPMPRCQCRCLQMAFQIDTSLKEKTFFENTEVSSIKIQLDLAC